MLYRIKRILLKTGELLTEHETMADNYLFNGIPPVAGEVLEVTCRGRTFQARVIWGNWQGRNDEYNSQTIVPLRVEEL